MFYFRETSHNKNTREITLALTDIGKSYPSREFFTSQICLLTLFAKIKFANISEFTVYVKCSIDPKSAFVPPSG